jgi:hypothetical protein
MSDPSWSSVISMEFMSLATPIQIHQIVDSFAGAEVHVILTARDLLRVLPSTWQNSVKGGRQWPLDRYLKAVMSDEADDGDGNAQGDRQICRQFWRRHDLVAICHRWVEVVGKDRFHLVTVPPPGADPDLLWHRFASVIGADPAAFDTKAGRQSNPSLSLTEARLMQLISAEIPDSGRNKRVLRGIFANKLVLGGGGPKVTIPRGVQEWAAQRSESVVEGLRLLDLQVVGALDDLMPVLPAPPAQNDPAVDEPVEVAPAELVTVAVRSAAALFEEIIRRDRPRHRISHLDSDPDDRIEDDE